MAKSKKSKILAMALCASVMTGIYASPVMAGVIEINPDNGGLAITINSDGNPPSNGIYVDRTNPDEPKIYGMFNITADQLATALTNQDLTLNSVTMGTETINATTIAQWNAAAKASENVGGITRSAGATAPGTGTTTIEGNTSFDANNMRLGTNVDPEGIVKISQDNGGLVRVGDKDSANVRIASNQITFNSTGTTVTARLSADGLTLSDETLDYTQLKNLNTTVKAGNVVDAKELNVEGQYGSFHVKDVTNGAGASNTMIYTENSDGTDTLYIDTQTGNLVTKGALNAGDGAFIANETGVSVGEKFSVSAENGGVQAVEYKVDENNVLNAAGLKTTNIDAGTGNVGGVNFAGDGNVGNVRTINGAMVEADNRGGLTISGVNFNNRVLTAGAMNIDGASGGLYVKDIDGHTMIYAGATNDGASTLRIDPENGNLSTQGSIAVVGENGSWEAPTTIIDGKTGNVAVGSEIHLNAADGAVTASSYNGVTLATNGEQVLVGDIDVNDLYGRTEGIDRLGRNGAGTTSIEGILHVDKVSETVAIDGQLRVADDVTTINADGTEKYSLNSIGENTAGIERIQNSAGNNITEIEDTLRIYDNGTISTVNGAFRINEQGNVFANAVNVADGAVVISENSINAFDSKFTVNKNGEVSTTGVNVAEGMFTASAGGVTMANNNLSVDLNGNIKAGTYNGVKIGMNEDGDIILGDGTVIDDNFNSDNVAGITRKPLDDSAPGSGNTTFIEQNTAISADGIVVTDPESGVSTKTKYNGFYVKDEYGNNVSSLTQDKLNLAGENLAYKDSEGNINVTADTYTAGDVAGENVRVKADGIYVKDGGTIVSSLKDDGLMLSNEQSGNQTLNATDIADIKGIDRSGNDTEGYTTTIEGATSFTKDGMTTNSLSVKGTYGGFHVEDVTNSETGESNTMIYTTDQEGHRTLSIDPNTGNLVTPGSLNVAGGRFVVDKDTGNMAVNAADGNAVFQVNGNDGTVHVGKVGGAQTVITGNSITTETLNVENIKLGNSMTDKDGNTITIGAAGVIDIEKDGNTVFRADTDNFEAHYDNYDLTLDGTNGFALSNETSSFTLKGDGFAFAGPVHLGNGTQVKFSHNGTDISLSSLVNRVENLEQKTQGISFDETTGSTTIADKVGTDGVESNNSMTVGNNGTTFENGTDSKTNINGGAIDADSSSIGNDVSGGSGSGSSGMTGNGTYTNGSEHSGHFVDKDSSYKFTNDANGFTGTVTDGKHTTTIENGAMGSNTTVKGDNASASSGVGIGNDGAFISDSVTNGDISHTVNGGSITDTVTNGDMTVTEVKDENGSATTVKDANGSSTVSQDRNGQTVSTGTGTSVNTGNDFSVTDNETGKSIYMSDIGHVEDIDSEIQNSDGSKTTVVDAVNNEAEIRRNEIERVDGRINNLENRVGELEDRIDKVGAMAAAIANLRTMGYDPAAPTEVAVGIGQYRDETGAALGLFHYPNRDFMLSLSVSTSGDEVMGGIGATWKFGRKSPEKVAEIKKAQAEADARRAEEAKLAKAEEMKQAAKEAKIKAQQERHAKLAAERAAQAEAAK